MRGDWVCWGLCLVAGLVRAEPAGTLDKVRQTGEIAVGFCETSMPFSYLDGRGAPVGFGVDLCLHIVDDAIARLMRTGEFEQLYRKWFEQPIPPKGLNLNHSMGAELKANLTVLSDQPAD